MAQLDDEKSMALFDICCLWVWLKERMAKAFSGEIVEQHTALFMKGWLANGLIFAAT